MLAFLLWVLPGGCRALHGCSPLQHAGWMLDLMLPTSKAPHSLWWKSDETPQVEASWARVMWAACLLLLLARR